MSDEPVTQSAFADFQRGFAEFQRRVFLRFDALDTKMDAGFEKVDARFDKVDARFRELDRHLDTISQSDRRSPGADGRSGEAAPGVTLGSGERETRRCR